MAKDWLPRSLLQLYGDSIDSLEVVIRGCPDDLWTASIWEVRLNDRHVWPIVAGMGAELPDGDRLQLHSAFRNVAFHVLFFPDHYLSGGVGPPQPPPPFRGDEEDAHTLPNRVYTREELLDYLEFCRRKAASTLTGLTDEQLNRPARIGRPFGDLLLHNLVQLAGHTEQLSLFLNREADWSDSRRTSTTSGFAGAHTALSSAGRGSSLWSVHKAPKPPA